ncbi:MAG TPA: alpha-glucan family phosphorylase [Syntrophales bacterium]|nr:alpha-glucan family phosphorylase [Syntrophales bacterium]HOL58717.1 alpha-glucan family phosphorylase [Syntrophales bacterium]HPO34995.1 alpha-glucan family phosphorylase [Syntrophales bacterium]
MKALEPAFLFEVSWEVCNKIGGIYTVITTKLREVEKVFGDRYILLGPDLKMNIDFEETDEPGWQKIREGTAIKGLSCRFGRWRIPGEPKVILVSASKRYSSDQLLYHLWETFGVDSIAGGMDYVEAVLFSYACGEVIETYYNLHLRDENIPVIAHFHEWMAGAGLLYLKEHLPEVGTVFTTHATILGRALSGAGIDIYAQMDSIAPQKEASIHNVSAKYSLEMTAAREADCFTTVSAITAVEVKNFLGCEPDVITPNGLDMENIPDLVTNRELALEAKSRILEAANRFLRRELPSDTRIIAISGRYEYRNKGLDIFLEALGQLENSAYVGPPLMALVLVVGGYKDLIPSLRSDQAKAETQAIPIATHRLENESFDPILQACNRLGLTNQAQNKVNVIFNPAYLNGHDGLFNMNYYEVLAGCDLGVFPSYYEPWGYTPLEAAAHAVPTVTTDQAGFGLWVEANIGEASGIILLRRRGRPLDQVIQDMKAIFQAFLSWPPEALEERRKSARTVAMKANWQDFISFYLEAFARARVKAEKRKEAVPEAKLMAGVHVFAGVASARPHFRSFTAIASLPENISRLRELAYNLWWAWNPRALDLFASLDLRLWNEVGNNPVRMLESVSPEALKEASENETYLALYSQIFQRFDEYMKGPGLKKKYPYAEEIKSSSPIAYFSTEYGLHECLPIYSGGLGTLSGDHLKTASDMGIPLVGVGLLYKNGYFQQLIDQNGKQQELYPENDFSIMPIRCVRDDKGQEVQISIELPGRVLFANIWEVKVGKVSLYLLDTDVPRNTPQDRAITARLYLADQKVRLEQEILLGIGGIRLLKKLGIKPCAYHINEGHSAFLLLERMGSLMEDEGLNFSEAAEVVRADSLFTTHTPVEAGNERFPRELMEHYFSGFAKRLGLSWDQFWELGRHEGGDEKNFYLNIMALKLTYRKNAVSKVHGELSRRMWRNVWKGFDETDIPIMHITNGAHFLSYLALRMKAIYDAYLGIEWEKNLLDPERWAKVQDIPDTVLWRVHGELKQKLLDLIRERITRNWPLYRSEQIRREQVFGYLNSGAMLIGFSRRFAPYKRAYLILSDLDRLDRLVNNPQRPVQIVFAGKAHPNDNLGKEILERVTTVCRDDRFVGRIFFLDNYDIRMARHLLQGVDVWLNTPRRPYEASGTSGEKAIINGVIHASVSDGWWVEGYDGTNGWTIGPVRRGYVEEAGEPDEEDAHSLYELLENTIVPLYYDRDLTGVPVKWMAMVKRSIQTLAPVYNTERMMQDYLRRMYEPAARRGRKIAENAFALAKEIADWKSKIAMRFSSLKLEEVVVKGIQGDSISVGDTLEVTVRIAPGRLGPEEIYVELVIGERGANGFCGMPERIPLSLTEQGEGGVLIYNLSYEVKFNGQYQYGVRVMPYHPHLDSIIESGLVLWG